MPLVPQFYPVNFGQQINPQSMDMKSTNNSPVLTDPVPSSKSRLGPRSNLLSFTPSTSAFSSGSYSPIPRKKTIPGKLDDVRASGWLDAMISSSPPNRKLNKETCTDFSSTDSDAVYRAWMGKCIALFLDYDGTLSPIVDDPERAFMSEEMRSTVRSVAKHFPTAIISGRSRDKVYEFVGLAELFYAGSHGMDIMGPDKVSNSVDHQDKEVNLFQPAREFIPMIEKVFKLLVNQIKDVDGATVENNKFCVSVHYRNVDEKSWANLAQLVHDVIKDYSRLRLTHGRKVLEIRPVIDWNKGKAVKFLLESLGLSKSEVVLPIYVGDDQTDEDAFKVLKEESPGYGILVSSVPKETRAFFSLRDTSEVMDFLKAMVRWKQSAADEVTR